MKALSTETRWHLVLVTGGDTMSFLLFMGEHGIEAYSAEGVSGSGSRPAVPTLRQSPSESALFRRLCFVGAVPATLERLRSELPAGLEFRYVWDGLAFRPACADGKTVSDFMKVAGSGDTDLVYIEQVSPKLSDSLRVRVTTGPYEGIEGHLVRIRKSRRVMIELPGHLGVATGYIRPEFLEPSGS